MAFEQYTYAYPSMNGTAVGNFGGLFGWANTITHGGFGVGIVVSFIVISLVTMLTYTRSMRKSLAPTMFMASIIAILLRGIDIITNDYYIITMIFLTAIASLWLFYGED